MCAKRVRNLQPFMKDQVSLEKYTASLCCGSCGKQRPETKMVCNVLSNTIEIICSIYKGLYFLLNKNHQKSLSVSRIFVFCLTMTQTRLIYCSNLYSNSIGPGLFALLSIAGFLPTLHLFVAFSFTMGAKDHFSTDVLMRKAGDRSITSLRLSRNRRCRTSTRWQG